MAAKKENERPREDAVRLESLVDQPKREAMLPGTQEELWKDPAAVALGRRGGLKGGPARAKALTADQRRAIARKAAAARWANPSSEE